MDEQELAKLEAEGRDGPSDEDLRRVEKAHKKKERQSKLLRSVWDNCLSCLPTGLMAMALLGGVVLIAARLRR